jgi:hypothetical protein
MSENCNQSCSRCSEDCAERKEQKTDFSEKLHEMSSVKKGYWCCQRQRRCRKITCYLNACSYNE